MTRRFIDRREAGSLLAEKLSPFKDNAVVFALPRGGVETGAEVAADLFIPLELVIARKISHPADPEFAIGAVTETGPAIWNKVIASHLDLSWLEQQELIAREEARRRRELYLDDHESVSVLGKTALMIDDGIATGLTMLAAVEEVNQQNPTRIIVAVPCASREAVDNLMQIADEVIVLADPDNFSGAVGDYYEQFPQLDDNDVAQLLNN